VLHLLNFVKLCIIVYLIKIINSKCNTHTHTRTHVRTHTHTHTHTHIHIHTLSLSPSLSAFYNKREYTNVFLCTLLLSIFFCRLLFCRVSLLQLWYITAFPVWLSSIYFGYRNDVWWSFLQFLWLKFMV